MKQLIVETNKLLHNPTAFTVDRLFNPLLSLLQD